MIRFIDSIPYAAPDVYMQLKVNEYWEVLNPKLKNGGFKSNSICKKIDRLLVQCKSNAYFISNVNYDRRKQKRHVDYLEYLEYDNYIKLEEIIKSSPEKLPVYIGEAFDILHSTDLSIRIKGTLQSHDFGKKLSDDVFTYKSFRSSQGCVNFYKNLGLEKKHCFYCGSSEISIISKLAPTPKVYRDSQNRMLFDLDHFYLKSRFPFLSLSFYNLIPCCGICNSTYRGAKDFNIKTHINPFLDSFDENYFFSFEDKEIAKSLQKCTPEIQTLTLKRKNNAPKERDFSSIDFEIQNRNLANLKDINNLLGDIMDYSHEGWFNVARVIHGYNNHRIPKARNKILECSNAKLNMDFIERIKALF